jgi:hypothetical protein
MAIDGQCIRGIGLQFHRIGTCMFRRMDQPDGFVEILAVVGGDFGYDVNRMAWAYGSFAYLYCFLNHSDTCLSFSTTESTEFFLTVFDGIGFNCLTQTNLRFQLF